MGGPEGADRDYLTGSVVASFCVSSLRWVLRVADWLCERVAAWSGVEGAFKRDPVQALWVILIPALIANGLTLALTGRAVPRGALLVWAGLAAVLLGSLPSGALRSLWETSLLVGFFKKRWGS